MYVYVHAPDIRLLIAIALVVNSTESRPNLFEILNLSVTCQTF